MFGSSIAGLATQFCKFGAVGFVNTLMSLGIYYTFIYFNKRLYAIAWLVAFISSTLNAYYWNSRHIFNSNKNFSHTEIMKTFITYGFTAALGFLIIYAHVDYFGFSERTAPLIALSITVPLNFALNKLWTFGGGRVRDDHKNDKDLGAPPQSPKGETLGRSVSKSP